MTYNEIINNHFIHLTYQLSKSEYLNFQKGGKCLSYAVRVGGGGGGGGVFSYLDRRAWFNC